MFDWIISIVHAFGAAGIAALMLLENFIPPLPSEVIMPLAGYLSAQGRFALITLIAAGTLGSVLGALAWYWVGHRIGADRLCTLTERYGRWLGVTPRDVTRAHRWLDRHRWSAVLLGRMVPGVRTVISVPAGMTRMPFVPFVICTTLGSALWVAVLTTAGFLLSHEYRKIAAWADPVSLAVLALAVSVYLWRVIFWHRARRVRV